MEHADAQPGGSAAQAHGRGRPAAGGRPAGARRFDLGAIGLVAVGGTVGTAGREAIALAVPSIDGVPAAIIGINLIGAFLLGMLLEAFARRGPETARHRRLRLLIGTGALGGFTTYSTLAVDGALLLERAPLIGTAILLGTVALGAVAAFAGMLVAAAIPGSTTTDGDGR